MRGKRVSASPKKYPSTKITTHTDIAHCSAIPETPTMKGIPLWPVGKGLGVCSKGGEATFEPSFLGSLDTIFFWISWFMEDVSKTPVFLDTHLQKLTYPTKGKREKSIKSSTQKCQTVGSRYVIRSLEGMSTYFWNLYFVDLHSIWSICVFFYISKVSILETQVVFPAVDVSAADSPPLNGQRRGWGSWWHSTLGPKPRTAGESPKVDGGFLEFFGRYKNGQHSHGLVVGISTSDHLDDFLWKHDLCKMPSFRSQLNIISTFRVLETSFLLLCWVWKQHAWTHWRGKPSNSSECIKMHASLAEVG